MFSRHFAKRHCIAMHHYAIPAIAFGGIEGKVRFAKERAGFIRPRVNPPVHADTASRLQAGGSGLERGVGECLANPCGMRPSTWCVAPGKHDHELLASVPPSES